MEENENQIRERMNMLLPVTKVKIFLFRKDYYCSKNKFYLPLNNLHLPRGLDVLIKTQDIFHGTFTDSNFFSALLYCSLHHGNHGSTYSYLLDSWCEEHQTWTVTTSQETTISEVDGQWKVLGEIKKYFIFSSNIGLLRKVSCWQKSKVINAGFPFWLKHLHF